MTTLFTHTTKQATNAEPAASQNQPTASAQREGTRTRSFDEELLTQYGSILDIITQDGYQGDLGSSLYELCYFLISIERIPNLPRKIKLDLLRGIGLDSQEKVTDFVDFLLRTQKESGAWSSDHRVDCIKDEIISTLIVIESLFSLYILPSKNLATPTVYADYSAIRAARISESIRSAQRFLTDNLQVALRDDKEASPIAFEALVFEHIKEVTILSASADTEFVVTKNPVLFPLLRSLVEAKLAHKIRALPQGKSTLDSVFDAIHSYIEEIPVYDLLPRSTAGSMGIYPSSTTQYLRLISRRIECPLTDSLFNDCQELEDYVRESFKISGQALYGVLKGLLYLQRSSSKGYFEAFYPSNGFCRWWAAMYLSRYPVGDLGPTLQSISRDTENKIGVTENFLDDVDTSSVHKLALQLSGQNVDFETIAPILSFYSPTKKSFICYEHEVRTSSSANIHALMSLCLYFKLCTQSSMPNELADYFLNPLERILASLDARSPFLQDKWHLSPFYVTSELITLLVHTLSLEDKEHISDKLRSKIESKLLIVVDYFVGNQNKDGGFCSDVTGYSNTEESCYAIGALLDVLDSSPDYLTKYDDLDERLRKAYCFLKEGYRNNRTAIQEDDRPGALSSCPYPRLWIAKGLYCPIHIVEALEISTLLRLKDRVNYQFTDNAMY